MIKYVAIAMLVLQFYAYTPQHLYMCGDFVLTITCIRNINHNHHPFFIHFSLTRSLFLHFLYIFLISSLRLGNKNMSYWYERNFLCCYYPTIYHLFKNKTSLAFLSSLTSFAFMVDSITFMYKINYFEKM